MVLTFWKRNKECTYCPSAQSQMLCRVDDGGVFARGGVGDSS
jgi:hypothetical protein